MPGFTGKILRIDLSRGEVATETPPENFYRRYLGGRGLAAYYLLKEVTPDTGPFDPGNLFILAPGVLSGTPIAGASRTGAASLSPLTGGFGSAEGGGFWGATLRNIPVGFGRGVGNSVALLIDAALVAPFIQPILDDLTGNNDNAG